MTMTRKWGLPTPTALVMALKPPYCLFKELSNGLGKPDAMKAKKVCHPLWFFDLPLNNRDTLRKQNQLCEGSKCLYYNTLLHVAFGDIEPLTWAGNSLMIWLTF
jgi:hypothetical protein